MSTTPQLTDPRIEFDVPIPPQGFAPGDFLSGEYSVKLRPEHELMAVETSVLWLTEGKGQEDIGVHVFERRKKQSISQETFSRPLRLSTVLPASPWSYDGKILRIRWCLRVRLFLAGGREVIGELGFRLGPQASGESA